MSEPIKSAHQERISEAMKAHWKRRKARPEPYFYAVGACVEDRRDHRPDICSVFFGNENTGILANGERVGRSYAEACEIARKIAGFLNAHYPNCNHPPRAKK
jgi:hypothetical protein